MDQSILGLSSFSERMHMSRLYRQGVLCIMFLALMDYALAQPQKETPRGELLYNTHCIACHTTHVHWRDQRLATDWLSLQAQVRRWQSNTQLNWDESDISAVTSYLNSLFYQFDVPERTSQAASKRLN